MAETNGRQGLTKDRQQIVHPIAPVYDENSSVLILGSFPSVKSREQCFFYGHKQNRFWKVMAAVYEAEIPQTVEEKKAFLLQNHVAVWDVIGSCTIVGSSDASIQDVKVNDLTQILQTAKICQIFCNGAKSFELYERYLHRQLGKDAIRLPSTSPANAATHLDQLVEIWQTVRQSQQK